MLAKAWVTEADDCLLAKVVCHLLQSLELLSRFVASIKAINRAGLESSKTVAGWPLRRICRIPLVLDRLQRWRLAKVKMAYAPKLSTLGSEQTLWKSTIQSGIYAIPKTPQMTLKMRNKSFNADLGQRRLKDPAQK